MLRFVLTPSLLCGCVASFPGAEVPAGTRGTAPVALEVSVRGLRLAESPSANALARWYCAQHAGPVACRAYGPPADAEPLRFEVDVELEVANRNAVAIPLRSAQFALAAFPGTVAAVRGAACVPFCPPSNTDCAAAACPGASPGFVRGRALGRVVVGARDRTRLVVRLQLDAEALRERFPKMHANLHRDIAEGRSIRFALPHRLEGRTIAENTESHFGPVRGTWWL